MIAIIFAIILIITVITMCKKDAKKRKETFDRFEHGMIIFVCVCLAVLVELAAWGIYSETAIETTETPEAVASVDLVALQDNASATGGFFLGSGSVSNKSYYAFYYETEHGYKYETLDAESSSRPVYIKYISAEETPHVDRYSIVERKTMTADCSNAWLFSIIAWLNYHQYEPGDLVSEEITSPALFAPSDNPGYYDNFRYEIHIPEGSIKQGYEIDLE